MDIKPNKNYYPSPKASPSLIEKILEDIAQGSTNKHAAQANGITERTFYLWIEQGKCDLENEIDSMYARFVQSLNKIEQEEIIWCRKSIKDQKKGHKGAQWTLEHVYWRHFSSSVAELEFNERLTELENQLRTGVQTNDKANSSEAQENSKE